MPQFTGQLDGPVASRDWVTGSGGEFVGRAANAIAKAIEDHAAEQEAKKGSTLDAVSESAFGLRLH